MINSTATQRNATQQIKKLQPSPAGTSSRKKGRGGGAGGQKSATKKSRGARGAKADAAKRKGTARVMLESVGNALGAVKTAGTIAWGARNLVFFAAAVAAMHLHGDYLAV